MTPENSQALVILGKNIGVGSGARDIREDNFHLSTESRMNVLAGGMLHQRGMDIILSTGETTGFPSEARAMKRYLQVHFPNISDERIILEEASYDTSSNAEEVKKIITEKKYEHVGLVTVGYHLDNATTLFERNGIKIDQQVASESSIRKRSAHHEMFITKWEKTTRIRLEQLKERIRGLLLHIDQNGIMLQKLTKITRR